MTAGFEARKKSISSIKATTADVLFHPRCFLKTLDFTVVPALAYRHKLYEYNLAEVNRGSVLYFYRSKLLPKVKDAYKRICKSLGKAPDHGLAETKESLTKERDDVLTKYRHQSLRPFGTSIVEIVYEYQQRINMLEGRPDQLKKILYLNQEEPATVVIDAATNKSYPLYLNDKLANCYYIFALSKTAPLAEVQQSYKHSRLERMNTSG